MAAVGYEAVPVAHGAARPEPSDPDHWVLRAALSWPLALLALGVALVASESAAAGWTVLLLAIAVELVGGWPFLRNSARLLRHGATNMDTLIALGTLAALAVTAVEAIALGGRHLHLGGSGAFAARLHGVMAPLIVAILATGRAVEARVRERAARPCIRCSPCARRPHGWSPRPTDDGASWSRPRASRWARWSRSAPARRSPSTGPWSAGWSAIDESMLTGEPLPVDRGPGGVVTGGTRNGSGVLVVRVGVRRRRVGAGPAAAAGRGGPARQGAPAADRRPDQQRVRARRSSSAAVVTFFVWWLVVGDLGRAVLAALAVLLVACPCAMGLAAPGGDDGRVRPGLRPRHLRPQRRRPRAAGQGGPGGLRQDGHPHRAARRWSPG